MPTSYRRRDTVGTPAEHLAAAPAAAQAAAAAGDRYWGRVTVPVPARDGSLAHLVVVGVYTGSLTDAHGPITDLTECDCARCEHAAPWDRAAQVRVAAPRGLYELHEVGWDHVTADRCA